MYTTPAVEPLASTLTNEPSSVPAPAPTLKRPHTMVAEAHTAVEHEQKGIVYVRIPGHDKTEPIDVDVEKPLGDVRGALKRFTPFQFDGNFRLKDSHDVLDASKSLRDLGLDCGVGQYVELEYHHSNYFPGLLGGSGWSAKKLALKKDCEDAGIDLKAAGLNSNSGLGDFRRALAEALEQSGQTSSRLLPSARVMASEILRSGIDRPPGSLRTLDEKVLESLYQQAQAELAKEQTARPRREATTEQSKETKEEEDVEMLEVTQITLGVAKDEKRLKAEVEKLLVEADKAWTCAKIKFHDAFVDLHAIDATSACSMAWWCRFLAVLET